MKNIYIEIVNEIAMKSGGFSIKETYQKIVNSMSLEQQMDMMLCDGVRVIDGVSVQMQWLRNGDWVIDPTLSEVESITNNGVVNIEFDKGVQYIETQSQACS